MLLQYVDCKVMGDRAYIPESRDSSRKASTALKNLKQEAEL